MSAKADAERREDALHARVEKSKERMRIFQVLICCEVEGLSVADAAQRAGVHRRTAEVFRYFVGLSSSTTAIRRRLANADKRNSLEVARE